MRDTLAALARCMDERAPCVLVTLVAARGSAPQEIGAKLLATAQGLSSGTIGGGRLEAHALRVALARLAADAPEPCALETVNLQRDLGMTCGGEVTLLYERVGGARWDIAVFGAGHVAQSVVRLLATLDCDVSVFDTRPEWIERVPSSPSVRAQAVDDLAGRVETLRDGAFIVVMTQGHATDLPVLRAAHAWGRHGYVGVMGSAVKAARLRRELEESGVSGEWLAGLRCPIGLPFGDSRPGEIAVSVVAELLQTRDALRRGPSRGPLPRSPA